MKNRFIAAITAGVMISASCSTVFAGVESAVYDGSNIVVSGTTSQKMAGERFSIMLHNMYDSNSPAESVVIAEQGVSGENGSFTYTIPLSHRIGDGNYTLRYGDASGSAEEVDLYIDRVSEEFSVSISEAGHIFFDPSDIKVNISFVNGETMQTGIVARVYTEDENELVFEDMVYKREIKSYEKVSDTLTIFLSNAKKQYGMFVLKLALVSTGSNPIDDDFTDGVRFSVAKKSDEPNNKIGMHTGFANNASDAAVNVKLLKNAGYHGIRDDLRHNICFTDGVWREPWRYNQWTNQAKANNLSQIIILSSGDIGFPKTEAEIEYFTNYTVAAVSNLVEDGVYWYELWNEPNWDYTAEEYANLLISVAPAIKAVNENVKILPFVTAGANNHYAANWIVDIIKILQERGLDPHDYIDYISIHPYRPLNQAPEKKTRTCDCAGRTESRNEGHQYSEETETIPGDSSIVARIDNLTNRLKEVGCDDIPFIATEIGWYSYEDAFSRTNCEECLANKTTALSEIGQAQYSVRASALLYNKLYKIYFHTLNNKTNTNTPMEKNFGFTEFYNDTETEIPYEAKPVFIAMANFNAMLGNAELIQENTDESSYPSLWAMASYDYVFQKDGKKTHLMWTTSSYSRSKTINVPNKAICIYDMYGNVIETQYNSNGSYSITLSGSPVYVEEIDATILEIVDKNGDVVTEIGNNTSLCASISSMANTVENGMLICATYKDSVLDLVEVLPVEIGKTSARTPYINTENADMIKAFYWKEINNTPYCEAVTIFK